MYIKEMLGYNDVAVFNIYTHGWSGLENLEAQKRKISPAM